MASMLEMLKKLLGPGMTAGFNPNEPNPIKTQNPAGVMPNLGMINSQTPRAPMDAVDGRANLQANVPEGLGDLNFQVNPNRQTVSALEMDSRGKVKVSKPGNAPFNPVDYQFDPEGRDRRDHFIQKTQAPGGWKEALKPFLAGAVLGGNQASRDPNASGWDILGQMGMGAATGGVINKFSPEGGASVEYEAFRAPQFRAQRAREDAEKDRQFGDFQRQQAMRMGGAQEEYMKERAGYYRAQAGQRDTPRYVEVNGGMFDPTTREFIKNPYEIGAQKPDVREVGNSLVMLDPKTQQYVEVFRGMSPEKVPSYSERSREADDELTAQDGSVEEIARASLAGRVDALKATLPAATRLILEKGKVMDNNVERDATPFEANAAAQLWQQMQDKELDKVRRETQGVRRGQIGARAGGGGGGSVRPPAKPSGAGTRRTVKDVLRFLD
jgi:hypothetical protein